MHINTEGMGLCWNRDMVIHSLYIRNFEFLQLAWHCFCNSKDRNMENNNFPS